MTILRRAQSELSPEERRQLIEALSVQQELVDLANRESIGVVFTLDRRHFGVYRPENGGAFRLLPE